MKSKEMLEKLLRNPEILVGKRIKHKIQESADDIPEWYDGTVLKLEKVIENVIRTPYEMTYDIDGPEERFTFKLIMELKKGNLIMD